MKETLRHGGLDPTGDVKITYGGSAGNLFGLAASGAIQGLVYSEPLPQVVTAAGMHKVATVSADREIAPILTTVLGFSSSLVDGHRAAVSGLISCLVDASKLALAKDQRVVAALAKASKSDEATAAAQLAGSPPPAPSIWPRRRARRGESPGVLRRRAVRLIRSPDGDRRLVAAADVAVTGGPGNTTPSEERGTYR